MLRALSTFVIAFNLCIVHSALGQSDPRDSLTHLLSGNMADRQRVDVLNSLSYHNYDIDDSVGLSYAKEALKLATKINYKEGIKYAYTFVGLGNYCMGNIQTAFTYYWKSNGIIIEANSVAVHNYVLWARLHSDLSNYDSAYFLFKKARSLTSIKSPADIQAVYKNIASLLIFKSKENEALLYLDSASQLIKYGDVFMEMEILSHYGMAYQNLGQYAKAQKLYDQLCTIAEANPNYYHQIGCKLNQSKIALIRGNFSSALKLSLQALTMTNQYNYEQYVDALTQTGEVYLELSQYELCAKYLYQALKISEEKGLKLKTAIIYNNLAWLTKIEGQIDEAMEATKKAQKIAEEIKNDRVLSEAHNVRGLIYFLERKFDLAMAEYELALALRKKIGDLKGVSATLYNQTEIYLELKQYEKALPILQKVVQLEQQIGNMPYLAMTYGIIARVLTDQKKFDEAFHYLEKARKTGEQEQSLYIKRENALHYAYYHEAKRELDKALSYQKQFQLLNDSIYNQQRTDKLAEYQALYKAEKRENEIELLNQKQASQDIQLKLQDSKIAQKNILILGSLVVALILALYTVRVYQQKVTKEEANKKLLFLNAQIANQRDELTRSIESNNVLRDALETREKQYREVVENAFDFIHEIDEKGNFTFVNSAIKRIGGYNETELIGQHYTSVIHRDYVSSVSNYFINAIKSLEEDSYLEFPVVSKEGKTIWVGQNTRFFYHNHKMIKASVVARDISKQKQAEHELIKSQREYEELVESLPIGVYKTITYANGEFAFLYISQRWCNMSNLLANDVLRDASIAHAIIHPADRESFRLEEEKSQSSPSHFIWEGRIVVNEKIKFIRIESRGKKTADGVIIRNGFQQDITARRLAELELVKAKEEAEKAYSVKSDFVSNMTHEMRTPLNGVIGFVDMLHQTSLSNLQTNYLKQVSQSANSLLGLIDNLLDFSKIEAGKLSLKNEQTNLRELIIELTETLGPDLRDKKITIVTAVDDALPTSVSTDLVRLRQIMQSLLSNAVKFTHEGEIEIAVSKLPQAGFFRFSVRDTGIGISIENHKKIFDAFVQEDSSDTKKYAGAGLGLTIANHLLKLMDSELLVTSAPGKGSTFYFDINLGNA